MQRHRLFTAALLSAAAACGDGGSGSLRFYPDSPDSAEGGRGDDTQPDAFVAMVGREYDRTIFPVGDRDWFAFTLEAGVEYELSTWNLCVTCDTTIFLFDTDGTTEIDQNDDYVGLDSRLAFTPAVTGTYYLRIEAYDEDLGIATYTFRLDELVDADNDGHSTDYDCDDAAPSTYFGATEVRGDGIDQDCDGADLPLGTLPDRFEDDDTAATASSDVDTLPAEWATAVYSLRYVPDRVRSIHDATDEDWIRLDVPPHSSYYFNVQGLGGARTVAYFEADGTTTWAGAEDLENTTDVTRTFLVRITGLADAMYYAYYYDYGVDADGDGFYVRGWGDERDCNDANDAIRPDATEVAGDGIDQNCDGID